MARTSMRPKEDNGGKTGCNSAYNATSGEATIILPNKGQHPQLQGPHKVNAGINKKVNSPGAEDKPGGKEVN